MHFHPSTVSSFRPARFWRATGLVTYWILLFLLFSLIVPCNSQWNQMSLYNSQLLVCKKNHISYLFLQKVAWKIWVSARPGGGSIGPKRTPDTGQASIRVRTETKGTRYLRAYTVLPSYSLDPFQTQHLINPSMWSSSTAYMIISVKGRSTKLLVNLDVLG